MKRFKVKTEYEKFYTALVTNNTDSIICKIFELDSVLYKLLKDANVLDIWCEEIKEEWQESYYPITLSEYLPFSIEKKMRLLGRMQSWADFHNKLNGFAPDWSDDCQYKYGIELNYRNTNVDCRQYRNQFLFQIAVSSKKIGLDMLSYFKSDIQELIDLKMI